MTQYTFMGDLDTPELDIIHDDEQDEKDDRD